MAYGVSNPFLQGFTYSTNFSPFINASNQAQQSLLNANNQAQTAANQGVTNAKGTLTGGLNQSLGITNPYTSGGAQAFDKAAGLAGGYNGQQLADVIDNNPVLQAINQQGQRAMATSAANQGLSGSGAFLQNVNQLAQNNTAQYIAQLQQQNANLAQIGVNPTISAAGNALNTANNQASLDNLAGQNNANASLAAGNINANTAMNIANAQVAQSTVAGIPRGSVLSQGSGSTFVNPTSPFSFSGAADPNTQNSGYQAATFPNAQGSPNLNQLSSQLGGGSGGGSSGAIGANGGAAPSAFNFNQPGTGGNNPAQNSIAQSIGAGAAQSPFNVGSSALNLSNPNSGGDGVTSSYLGGSSPTAGSNAFSTGSSGGSIGSNGSYLGLGGNDPTAIAQSIGAQGARTLGGNSGTPTLAQAEQMAQANPSGMRIVVNGGKKFALILNQAASDAFGGKWGYVPL